MQLGSQASTRSPFTKPAVRGAKGKRTVGGYLRVSLNLNVGSIQVGQIPLFTDKEVDMFLVSQKENLGNAQWEFEVNHTQTFEDGALSFDSSAPSTGAVQAGDGYLNVYVHLSNGRVQVGGIKLNPEKQIDAFILNAPQESIETAEWQLYLHEVAEKKALSFA
jgi:hypothetical protein